MTDSLDSNANAGPSTPGSSRKRSKWDDEETDDVYVQVNPIKKRVKSKTVDASNEIRAHNGSSTNISGNHAKKS